MVLIACMSTRTCMQPSTSLVVHMFLICLLLSLVLFCPPPPFPVLLALPPAWKDLVEVSFLTVLTYPRWKDTKLKQLKIESPAFLFVCCVSPVGKTPGPQSQTVAGCRLLMQALCSDVAWQLDSNIAPVPFDETVSRCGVIMQVWCTAVKLYFRCVVHYAAGLWCKSDISH